jgi:hypothetical protein
MKFTKAALSLLFITAQATAWTSRAALRPRTRAALVAAATQLHSSVADKVSTEVVGTEATESFRLKFKQGSDTVSPWHDIPLKNSDGSYNMVGR